MMRLGYFFAGMSLLFAEVVGVLSFLIPWNIGVLLYGLAGLVFIFFNCIILMLIYIGLNPSDTYNENHKEVKR